MESTEISFSRLIETQTFDACVDFLDGEVPLGV